MVPMNGDILSLKMSMYIFQAGEKLQDLRKAHFFMRKFKKSTKPLLFISQTIGWMLEESLSYLTKVIKNFLDVLLFLLWPFKVTHMQKFPL